MKLRLAPLLASLMVFLGLVVIAGLGVFVYLSGQTVEEVVDDLQDQSRLLLYRYGMVERLTVADSNRLYQKSCTRRCHGREVVERNPRTAAEWEIVMARMRAPDRAGLDERLAEAVTRHLQIHFLSNVPTVLPPATMKFVKQYLWRSDFGESDLFLDIIFVPREHAHLLRYLGVRKLPKTGNEGVFIVFVNTHQGRVPVWNLADFASLRVGHEAPRRAEHWEVLYRDGQEHHEQGVLGFGTLAIGGAKELELSLQLGGLGTRRFVWTLPVPQYAE